MRLTFGAWRRGCGAREGGVCRGKRCNYFACRGGGGGGEVARARGGTALTPASSRAGRATQRQLETDADRKTVGFKTRAENTSLEALSVPESRRFLRQPSKSRRLQLMSIFTE